MLPTQFPTATFCSFDNANIICAPKMVVDFVQNLLLTWLENQATNHATKHDDFIKEVY